LTPSTNPWNAIYKLATNKTKKSQPMTTSKNPDGLLTSNLIERVKFVTLPKLQRWPNCRHQLS
jgi:hypothetical protein